MKSKIKSIAIFCGSNLGHDPIYKTAAESIANLFSQNNIQLIYGGANVGIMAVLANTMLANQSEVIGVIPQYLVDVEIAHNNLTKLHIVESMQQRKELIMELADAFVLLPGGFGSLDEFFEVLTFLQLGFITKPVGILNINGYYEKLIELINHMYQQGYVKAEHKDMIIINSDPEKLIEAIHKYECKNVGKWINKD